MGQLTFFPNTSFIRGLQFNLKLGLDSGNSEDSCLSLLENK